MTESLNDPLQLGICVVILLFDFPLILFSFKIFVIPVWISMDFLLFAVSVRLRGFVPDDVQYIVADWICSSWFSPNLVLYFIYFKK